MKLLIFNFILLLLSTSAWADYIGSDACSPNEKWTITAKIPTELRDGFSLSGSNPSENVGDFIQEFSQLEKLRKKAKHSSHQAAAADFLIARHFFKSQFYHIAQQGFTKVLNGYSNNLSKGIKVAAIECLTKIATLYPTISLASSKNYQSFLQIPYQDLKPAQKTAMRAAAIEFFKAGIAKPEDVRPMFNANTAESLIGNTLFAVQENQPEKVISHLSKYKTLQLKSDYALHYEDWIYLTLGRAYFERRDFEKSVSAFNLVPNDSNYLPESLSNKAWAHLHLKDYPAAIGSAYAVLRGPLAKTFQPEAIQIASIVHLELCQAEKTKQQFSFYSKLYEPSHRWLGEWLQTHPEMRQKSGYKLAVEYKNNGDAVPARVALEWWRTPGVLSAQREINLIFNERSKYKEIISNPLYKNSASKTAITITLKSFLKVAEKRERNAVSIANTEIEFASKAMLENLNITKNALDLIEAEALSMSTSLASSKKKKGRKIASEVKNEHHWNWGKRSKDANQEVWEDELDALQGDLKNYCK